MANRRSAQTAEAIRAEIDDLRTRLGVILESIQASLAAGGSEAKQVVEEKGHAFLSLASELIDNLRRDATRTADAASARAISTTAEAADDMLSRTEDCIRAHPLTSVSIAFILGWVGSRLMAGRR